MSLVVVVVIIIIIIVVIIIIIIISLLLSISLLLFLLLLLLSLSTFALYSCYIHVRMRPANQSHFEVHNSVRMTYGFKSYNAESASFEGSLYLC